MKLTDEGTIVGSCAFTGPLVNNRSGVSYWAYKQHRQGIATNACLRLISIVKETDAAIILIAKTAPERNASTNILEQCRFIFCGIVQDHKIGDGREWTLKETPE